MPKLLTLKVHGTVVEIPIQFIAENIYDFILEAPTLAAVASKRSEGGVQLVGELITNHIQEACMASRAHHKTVTHVPNTDTTIIQLNGTLP